MIDRRQMCRFLVVILVSILGCERATAEVNHELRAASVLFGQFETVFYAKADLLSNSGAYEHVAKHDADIIRFPFFILQKGFNSLGDDNLNEILNSSEAVLVGAKDFRPPSGLGPVRSQRCYVFILKRNDFDLHKHFPQAPATSVAGVPAWNWSAKLGEFGEEDPSRPSSFYAAQIAGSFLVVSNNLEDLQATAKGLISAEKPETILAGIRDWELIRRQKIWGYRRYQHNGVVDRNAAGMWLITPGAEALMFFVDFDKKIGVMRLTSSDPNEDVAAKINATAKLPSFKAQARGVWETTFPLTGDESSFDRLVYIMSYFGFGVYM